MRLIGSVKSPEEAFVFQKFIKSQGIDLLIDRKAGKGVKQIYLWVVNEDDQLKAQSLLERYLADPLAPEFYVLDKKIQVPTDYDTSEPLVVQKSPKLPVMTWLWIFISALIFIIQTVQEGNRVILSPINQTLFYDFPKGYERIETFIGHHGLQDTGKNISPEVLKQWYHLQDTAYFHGFLDMIDDPIYQKAYRSSDITLFEKIKEGELYRFLTPVLLHGSLLHILFNMLLLFMLMKQIEIKLGILRLCVFAIISGVCSNTAQYLVSGPFFGGASGIIMAMAAFIWIRQKKAPWEGYILSRSLVFFLMMYVIALVALSIGVFVFNLSSHQEVVFGIANTAHVVGGGIGLILGASKFFRRV